MKKIIQAALALSISCFYANAAVFKPTHSGGLSTSGAELCINAYSSGWHSLEVKGSWEDRDSDTRRFSIERDGKRCFTGTSLWKKDGNSILGRIEIECNDTIRMQSLSLALNIPLSENIGKKWTYGTNEETIPSGISKAELKHCSVPLPEGEKLEISFDRTTPFTAQDMSRWSDKWLMRFGPLQTPETFKPGDKAVFECRVSCSGKLEFKKFNEDIAILPGEQWARLDNHLDIEPGSALDFSNQGLQDAPAGKYGWLKAENGHFEFEGLKDKEQRFYGINLCFSACYPTHEEADMLTDRLVRLGYNSIRIHHHDETWGKADPQMLDRLDYLLAKAFEKGLYVTTDMYVSRNVPWRSLGIDREGIMDKDLFKTYVAFYEPAFKNWCEFSKAFLEHLNPYTGRMYKDEPGMPLLSIINEGELFMSFNSKKDDPILLKAYKEFTGKDDPLVNHSPDMEAFSDYLEKRVAQRCTAFLRELGCKALLTNDNNGGKHGDLECATPLYDYVDNHFYIDHPRFLVKSWKLPSQCDNANPVVYGGPGMFKKNYAKGFSKPYTITEWNFSGPGKYRGLGGILTGAMASIQDWDGLWRFAYSHSREGLTEDSKRSPSYFDAASDPLAQASDRASICLFLRNDASQEEEIAMNQQSGVMIISTGRTCGIFAPEGKHTAGALTAEISGAPGTVCLSSIDGKDIVSSRRMLLSHITDLQGNGSRYADSERKVLLAWGKGILIEKGEASIELELNDCKGLSVYELDTTGKRIKKIPSKITGKGLSFKVSTFSKDGYGRIYYEITDQLTAL